MDNYYEANNLLAIAPQFRPGPQRDSLVQEALAHAILALVSELRKGRRADMDKGAVTLHRLVTTLARSGGVLTREVWVEGYPHGETGTVIIGSPSNPETAPFWAVEGDGPYRLLLGYSNEDPYYLNRGHHRGDPVEIVVNNRRNT
jgi:hypothetical protein